MLLKCASDRFWQSSCFTAVLSDSRVASHLLVDMVEARAQLRQAEAARGIGVQLVKQAPQVRPLTGWHGSRNRQQRQALEA